MNVDDLNVDVKKADTKTALIDMDVLRENFCLMKGELPRSYSVLLDRFHVFLNRFFDNREQMCIFDRIILMTLF